MLNRGKTPLQASMLDQGFQAIICQEGQFNSGADDLWQPVWHWLSNSTTPSQLTLSAVIEYIDQRAVNIIFIQLQLLLLPGQLLYCWVGRRVSGKSAEQ